MPSQSLIGANSITELQLSPHLRNRWNGGTVTGNSSTQIFYDLIARVIANSNITLDGTITTTIDGVNLVFGDIICINGQTDKKQNGLYSYTNTVWQRFGSLFPAMTVKVSEGSTDGNTFWILKSDSTITGTDNIEFNIIAPLRFRDYSYTKLATFNSEILVNFNPGTNEQIYRTQLTCVAENLGIGKVKLSSVDGTTDFLFNKLQAGYNVILSSINDSGTNKIVINASTQSAQALIYFLETRNAVIPNNTIPAHKFVPLGAETNIDFVISPKGSGAIIANIPDNTTTGGMKRGIYAVDLQRLRGDYSQVAGGYCSVIAGGDSNRAGASYVSIGGGIGNSSVGNYSVISGGRSNTANGNECFIGGGHSNSTSFDRDVICGGEGNRASGGTTLIGNGLNNTASGANSTILNGYSNTVSNDKALITGGSLNIADGIYNFVGNGASNQVHNDYATIINGSGNVCHGSYDSILGGLGNNISSAGYNSIILGGDYNSITNRYAQINASSGAKAYLRNQHVKSDGIFGATTGTAQKSELIMIRAGTGASGEIFLGGISPNRLAIPVNTAWQMNFKGAAYHRTDRTQACTFWLSSLLFKRTTNVYDLELWYNGESITTINLSPNPTTTYAGGDVALSMDTVNGSLKIKYGTATNDGYNLVIDVELIECGSF